MQHEPVGPDPSDPVAGIDVSKAKLDLWIDTVNQRLSVDNTDAAIAKLVPILTDHKVRLIVIESTGRYHRRVAAALLEAGLCVSVIDPKRARAFAHSLGKLEKTDQIDAAMLAQFGRATQPQVAEKPRENQLLLQDLLSRRRGLTQMRVAELNRGGQELGQFLASQSSKLLRLLEQQIEDLDREIAKLIEADDDWHNKAQIIDSVPGVGPDTANQLVIHLPELGRLDRQEIAKLAGVAPLCRDSGASRGQRAIRGGRMDARNCLYMAAFNARQYCPRFKAFFDGLIERGKHYQVAMTACMRKLLVVINQMVKTKTHWNKNLVET